MELLLEEIRDQQRATVEFVQTVEDRLRGEIRETREELRGEIRVLQAVVRKNSGDIQSHGQAIARLDTSVARLDTSVARLDTSVDRLDASVSRLDTSVSRNTKDIQANTEAIARVERKLETKVDIAVVAALDVRMTNLEEKVR
jgi:chromosome segregation ATPase